MDDSLSRSIEGLVPSYTTAVCAKDIVQLAGFSGNGYAVAPMLPGDTLTVTDRIFEVDATHERSTAAVEVAKKSGEVAAVADHVVKWLRP